MAVGVARPNAQGQAMTSTLTKIVKEKDTSFCIKYHIRADTNAIPITIGTKYIEIRSAILAIGAFLLCASSTIRIIFESVVSSLSTLQRINNLPSRFIVP